MIKQRQQRFKMWKFAILTTWHFLKVKTVVQGQIKNSVQETSCYIENTLQCLHPSLTAVDGNESCSWVTAPSHWSQTKGARMTTQKHWAGSTSLFKCPGLKLIYTKWLSGFLRHQTRWHLGSGHCRFTNFCLKRVSFSLRGEKFKEPNVSQPAKTMAEINSLSQHYRFSKVK